MICAKCQVPHRPDRPCPTFVTKALVGLGIVGLVAGMMSVADGSLHTIVGMTIRH